MELESHQGQKCQTNNLNNVNNGYFYCGRYRKPAVKTRFTAQNITPIKKKSPNLVGYSGGLNAHKVFDEMPERDEFKEEMISPKFCNFEGKSQVDLLGNGEKMKSLSACNNSHKVFDEMSERDEPEENMISTKIGTLGGKSQVGMLRKKHLIECNESEYDEWEVLESLEREKKKKHLNLYKSMCELLKEEGGKGVDIEAWKVLNGSGKIPKYDHIIGPIMGVDVGDDFDSMVELMVVGLHYHLVHKVSYTNRPNYPTLACSIVSTEGYWDEMLKGKELIYTSESGEFDVEDGKNKEVIKRGNLALKNSIDEGNFVRVVRGVITKIGSKNMTKFVYDGLYKVVKCCNDVGSIEFVLRRCPGQRVIEWEKYR